jgi:4-hydroxyphenylpyruvate dioxygenase
MDLWVNYLNKSLNFETFIDFGPGDISTQYSALLSKVVRSTEGPAIKNPINEPYDGLKKSQIEEYIDEYLGSGIQHIAVITNDIIKTIAAMRKNGMEFLSVPDSYYDTLKQRGFEVTEDIAELKKYGILCDIEGKGYLLQLFTKPIGDRPTFFYEIITRRKGAQGFGQGNFQALFESIERDQAQRGSLEKSK